MKYNSVAAVIKNEKDEILVEDHVKIGGYVIPGGKMDKNESEYSSLCRELFEELGIIVDHMVFIKQMYFPDVEYPVNTGNYADFDQGFYTVEKYHEEIVNKEPTKHTALLWKTKEELINDPHTSRVLKEFLLSE